MIINMEDIEDNELPINKIICGDASQVLKKLPSNSVDAVVTDPPYGLEFMDQEWDKRVPSTSFWREVLRVMKPGAYLLSFFGTRTYHRGVVNIEDAGFAIRDMIVWLYGSGFPKSQAIDKLIDKELGVYDKRKIVGLNPNHRLSESLYKLGFQGGRGSGYLTEPASEEAKKWIGWGTTLKPACEPIVLARKPISEKNIARNILRWGVGGLNIDACRVGTGSGKKKIVRYPNIKGNNYGQWKRLYKNAGTVEYVVVDKGRFPANVILDEEAAKILDKQSGFLKSGDINGRYKGFGRHIYGSGKEITLFYKGDAGGASRFFYCAKAGRNERFAYCQDCDKVIPQTEWEKHKDHKLLFHTTVKPLKLMEYLVRLVTPPNGVVLDPFLGTGTTAIACLKQGFRFIGIEIETIYCKIAEHRIKPYLKQTRLDTFT